MSDQLEGSEASTVSLNGLDFVAVDLVAAADLVVALGSSRNSGSVRLTNAYSVALADSDQVYKNVLRSRGVNFPDGTPLVWALRLRSGGRRLETVRGPSLFRLVLDRGRSDGLRHFFLGTTADTLDKLSAKVESVYSGVNIAGAFAPDFGPLSESFYTEAARRVGQSGADIVWVGLGTPKQDHAAAELSKRTGILHVAVGAAFDFVAGTTAEAPALVQGSGLEWVYRFAKEPRRLWRRYLFGNARFIKVALLGSCSRGI